MISCRVKGRSTAADISLIADSGALAAEEDAAAPKALQDMLDAYYDRSEDNRHKSGPFMDLLMDGLDLEDTIDLEHEALNPGYIPSWQPPPMRLGGLAPGSLGPGFDAQEFSARDSALQRGS